MPARRSTGVSSTGGEPAARAGWAARTGRTLRSTSGRGARFAADTASGVRAVIHGFRGEHIGLRAAALTYISIFSLVPLLTVTLVLLEALHQEEFHQRMEGFIQELLAPGIREETARLLQRFIERASSAAAGGIGFIVLAFAGGGLLKNLDASLNEIWNIRRKRPWHLRLLIYAFILLLGPVLVAVSLSGTAGIHDLLLAAQVPYVHQVTTVSSAMLAIAAATFLYYFAPNAPVRLRSAIAGGLVAGSAWDAAKVGYTIFGAQIFRYNPVYGSLGAAPLFLAWIYVSWYLVLFGARLAYAVEHASVSSLLRQLGDHTRARELVAARIAQEVTSAQLCGRPPPTVRELVKALGVPEERIRGAVDRLDHAGLLASSPRGGLVPARLPEQISLAELSIAVGGLPAPVDCDDKDEPFRELHAVFARADEPARKALGKLTWADLVPAGAPPASEDVPTERASATPRRNP